MREFTIQENDANQRLDKFITKTLKTLPKNLMYKYIRNKKIKVNRARCEISQYLQVGDTIQCYIAEEFFEHPISYDFLEVPSTLHILYEDEHLLVVDKPIGLLAHKDEQGIQDNLADRILHYLYDQKSYDPSTSQSFTPALCHRIDRNTQGIVIAAKSAEALRAMNASIKEHQLQKKYLCIIEGHMPEKEGLLTLYHTKDEQANRAILVNSEKEGYKEIKTAYRTLQATAKYSLLEVSLLTGKSHQIRATFAHVQHPLLGDVKYGAKPASWKYQALCAYYVKFHFNEQESSFAYLNDKQILLTQIQLLQYFNTHCT